LIQTDAFQYSTFVSFFNGFGKIIRYVVPELINILLENLEKYLQSKNIFQEILLLAPPLEYYYIWS
jgi:lipid II:glycine glycyltransferase (peptidoglycan interpeptide bridge formation enzyme)